MEPIRIVRTYDPAIDSAPMKPSGAWEEFLGSRDSRLLTFHEGRRPVVFVASWPTRRQVAAWIPMRFDQQFDAAFRECVKTVDGLLYPDGSRRTWSPADPSKPLRDDELELFAPCDIQHVGEVVFSHGFFPRDVPLCLQLRDTCRAATIAAGVASQRLRAARTREQDAALSADARPPLEVPPLATP